PSARSTIRDMKSRIALRLAFVVLFALALASRRPACAARDIADFGGGGTGGSSACGDLGATCGAGKDCCGDLQCNGGLCKPEQICHPDGEPCLLTPDGCMLDCLGGFCGGMECKPEGKQCESQVECCNFDCFGNFCGG